jgi:hypothetical protein
VDPRCHDLCADCGKVRYGSREEALIAAAKEGKRKSRPYRCGSFWHYTRWPIASYEIRARRLPC